MKRIHRLLLAWLLMLALPLQGFAGTHLLMCAQSSGPHARHMAQGAAPRALPCHGLAASASDHPAKHDTTKPATCAACSLLAPMAISVLLPPDLDGPVSTAIPFHAPRLPSVAPALPDRPPRLAAA